MTLRIPPALRPTVMTTMMMLFALVQPLAVFGVGPVLDAFGAQPVLVAFAVAQTVAMAGDRRVRSLRPLGSAGRRASRGSRMMLRAPGLRPLLVAQAVSSLGSQMTFLALPWFVLVTTGSATRMGVVLAVELLPVALLGIPSGTLVAKLGARRTLLLCDAGRAPVMLAIPLLHSAGLLSFPLLLVCVARSGSSSRRPSRRSG